MPEHTDFLVEIGTEEMPPRSLENLSLSFARALEGLMDAAELAHGPVKHLASPRRLAVSVAGLAARQPERETERRGPPTRVAYDDQGKPTRALLAFAETCGVEPGALETLETPKGTWLVHRATVPGKPVVELLGGMVTEALSKLPVPRPMRWGDKSVEFVRPVHWVVMLYGNEVVEAEILGLAAGRVTRGHRFMGEQLIELEDAGGYVDTLQAEGKVLVDIGERRDNIRAQVIDAASDLGGEAVIDPAVLNEVTALVEWPVAIAGRYEESFLELPSEVLVATLQGHQRYFPITDADGSLLPGFVTVANIESRDIKKVRSGNETVVRPRLKDAAFFYETDRARTLEARLEDLKNVVFQIKLGSVHDKSRRVSSISQQVARSIGSDLELAERAGLLAKCDLVTDMVGEFPELQGVMGRYYARHDGEHEEVAEALAEQYLPRFAGDRLPATATGQCLAIADKLDTLVAIFAIGQRPTGTKDPFGLRRAALGVLRIIIECGLDLDLVELVKAGAGLLPVQPDDGLEDGVYDYVMERLRAYYLDGSGDVTTEMFDAVLAQRPTRPLDFHRRIGALGEFMKLDAATSLTAANKRIVNILRQADRTESAGVDEAGLVEEAEKALFREMLTASEEIRPAIASGDYTQALRRLASLRGSVDEFFDAVLVMAEDADLRANRLALLGELRELFLYTADLSRLPNP